MSIKLLIIPDKLESEILVSLYTGLPFEIAFTKARKEWSKNPEQKTINSVAIGDFCKLYSHAPPDYNSHISPKQLWSRMQHTIHKDVIHLTTAGNVYRPGIEFFVSEAKYLQKHQKNLREATYSKSFGIFWGSVLWLGKATGFYVRRLYGEKVEDLFCAEDKSFYGSLHTRDNKVFASVHGHSQDDVLRGLIICENVLFNKKSP